MDYIGSYQYEPMLLLHKMMGIDTGVCVSVFLSYLLKASKIKDTIVAIPVIGPDPGL